MCFCHAVNRESWKHVIPLAVIAACMGGIAIDKKKIIEDEEKQKKIDEWRKIQEWIFDNILFYRIDNFKG